MAVCSLVDVHDVMWCGADDATTSSKFDVLRQRGVRGARGVTRYSVQPDVVGLMEPRSGIVHRCDGTHAI